MIIVYGTGTYGPVDRIEGLGQVESRFGHVFWTPIIPLFSSFFVFDQTDDEGEKLMMPIPFSAKSMLAGWIRGASFWAGLGSLITSVMHFVDGLYYLGGAFLVASVIGFACFVAIGNVLGRCSPERRAELLALVGISEAELAGQGHAQGYPSDYAQGSDPGMGYPAPAAYAPAAPAAPAYGAHAAYTGYQDPQGFQQSYQQGYQQHGFQQSFQQGPASAAPQSWAQQPASPYNPGGGWKY